MGKQIFNTAAAAERRDYHRRWRAKNPDKVRIHNATYWERRAEKRLAAQEQSNESDK